MDKNNANIMARYMQNRVKRVEDKNLFFRDEERSLMDKVYTQEIDHAEIVIGIPSYNEADNISFVVEKCNQGLRKYFPSFKSVIINVDNNSPDNTKNSFLHSMNTIPKIYISTPAGVKGKGNNFYNLFTEAKRLNAKVVVVVDADLRSITPEWIRDLATPILQDKVDYVTPLYSRNEYDGTITNNICYPLIYGLLGKNIRQPIGGDFALSGKVGRYYLKQAWQESTRQYGVDIFMTLSAITGGFRVGQVGLGAKIHKPSAPKLGPMFVQVVSTLFQTLLDNKGQWENTRRIEKLPEFGKHQLATPQSLSIDYKMMKATATQAFQTNKNILQENLTAPMYQKVHFMFENGKINIGVDLWSSAVYDLLYSYQTAESGESLVEAMKALYFGRVVSFIRQTLDLDYEPSEKMIQKQAQYFFRKRKYLLQKYNQKKEIP